MLGHLITVLSFVLLVFPSESFQNQILRPQMIQKSSLSKVQSNLCSYNGSINNSTVVELGNCNNNFYFIGLNIGTGPQYFNFQFDTGSPTLWIPLGSSPSGFNQSISSTYVQTDKFKNIDYVSGTGTSGVMGYDIVSVNQTPISANDSILFALYTSMVYAFGSSVYGLVGMDYGSYPNFLDIAYQNGQISTSAFSLDLNRMNQTSYMYYNNGLPQDANQNTLWVPLFTETQFWELGVLGMSANGIDMTSLVSKSVILDSGTSAIVLTRNLYNEIVQQFFSTSSCTKDSDGQIFCPCNGTWPTLAFMFQGAEVYVPGTAYQFQTSSGTCKMGLLTSGTPTINLGDIFFREYTITFDRINKRIGFNGTTTFVATFDPKYFVILQYVFCGLCFALFFTGIGLWLYGKSRFKKGLQHSSGTQQVLKIVRNENHQIN